MEGPKGNCEPQGTSSQARACGGRDMDWPRWQRLEHNCLLGTRAFHAPVQANHHHHLRSWGGGAGHPCGSAARGRLLRLSHRHGVEGLEAVRGKEGRTARFLSLDALIAEVPVRPRSGWGVATGGGACKGSSDRSPRQGRGRTEATTDVCARGQRHCNAQARPDTAAASTQQGNAGGGGLESARPVGSGCASATGGPGRTTPASGPLRWDRPASPHRTDPKGAHRALCPHCVKSGYSGPVSSDGQGHCATYCFSIQRTAQIPTQSKKSDDDLFRTMFHTECCHFSL